MLGSLTLDCNTCNPSLKFSRIIGNKVQTHIGCVRGRWVSMVFNGFQWFSIVFNGLSLHEVNTQGVMWSVIGEVLYLFIYYFIIIIIIFIFFFVFHKPTTGSPGGIGVLPPYPQQCEGHASRIMWGMSQTMVWGASWNLGGWSENNKCLGL